MPDLKAALTEALREHDIGYQRCRCGWFTEQGVVADAVAAHLADVLLALPGVAVIQLPEPDEETQASEFENGSKWFAGGDVVLYDDGEIHLFGTVWPALDIRGLGIAALAAAVLSEGETRA